MDVLVERIPLSGGGVRDVAPGEEAGGDRVVNGVEDASEVPGDAVGVDAAVVGVRGAESVAKRLAGIVRDVEGGVVQVVEELRLPAIGDGIWALGDLEVAGGLDELDGDEKVGDLLLEGGLRRDGGVQLEGVGGGGDLDGFFDQYGEALVEGGRVDVLHVKVLGVRAELEPVGGVGGDAVPDGGGELGFRNLEGAARVVVEPESPQVGVRGGLGEGAD